MFKGYLPRTLGLKKFCAKNNAPRLRTKSDLLPLEPLEMGRTRCAIHVLRVSFRGCRCFLSVFPPRTHGCSCENSFTTHPFLPLANSPDAVLVIFQTGV
jgi:hypothetical protein